MRELIASATLLGHPQSWARARDAGDHYANPAGYARWLTTVGRLLASVWRDAGGRRKDPEDGPVEVELVFWLERPKRRPASIPTDLWARKDCPAIGRQDVDNLAAAIFDAVTRAGWWTDDTRAAALVARKYWLPAGDTRERTEIRMYRDGGTDALPTA